MAGRHGDKKQKLMITATELETVYLDCHVRLVRIAFCLLGDHDEARDTVQDVFLSIIEKPVAADKAEAYLATAVRNRALDRLRSLSRRQRVERMLPLDDDVLLSVADCEDDMSDTVAEVNRIVATGLSPSVRSVVREVFYRRNSYRDAAAHLGISVATVNKHVVSALRILRNRFNVKS